ncbi:hypothetical protein EXIGLDRAFT_704200, partial [Exidia glandulosa HHB12029]
LAEFSAWRSPRLLSNKDALKNTALFDAEWDNPSRNRDWHYKVEAIRELQLRLKFIGRAVLMYKDAARRELVALCTEVLLIRRAELELDIENFRAHPNLLHKDDKREMDPPLFHSRVECCKETRRKSSKTSGSDRNGLGFYHKESLVGVVLYVQPDRVPIRATEKSGMSARGGLGTDYTVVHCNAVAGRSRMVPIEVASALCTCVQIVIADFTAGCPKRSVRPDGDLLVSLSVIVCMCCVGSWDAKTIEGLLYALVGLLHRMNDLECLSVTVDLPESDVLVSVEHLMDTIELSKLYHVRLCLMGFSITSSHAVVLPGSLCIQLAVPVHAQRTTTVMYTPHQTTCSLMDMRRGTRPEGAARGFYSLERLVVLKLEDVPISFTTTDSLRVLSQLKRLDLHPSVWVEWPVDCITDKENLLPDVVEVESPPWHGGGTSHLDPGDDEHPHTVLVPAAMEWEDDERMTLSPTEAQYTYCFLERVVRDLLHLEVLHIGGAMHNVAGCGRKSGPCVPVMPISVSSVLDDAMRAPPPTDISLQAVAAVAKTLDSNSINTSWATASGCWALAGVTTATSNATGRVHTQHALQTFSTCVHRCLSTRAGWIPVDSSLRARRHCGRDLLTTHALRAHGMKPACEKEVEEGIRCCGGDVRTRLLRETVKLAPAMCIFRFCPGKLGLEAHGCGGSLYMRKGAISCIDGTEPRALQVVWLGARAFGTFEEEIDIGALCAVLLSHRGNEHQ